MTATGQETSAQEQLRASAIERGEIHHCERCGDKLDNTKAVWLELSTQTGRYSATGVPESESQGWFAFGSACARAVLKNGGKCVHIKERA
jgi:hypothetical protein